MPANRVQGTLLQRSVSFLFGITIYDDRFVLGRKINRFIFVGCCTYELNLTCPLKLVHLIS